MRHKTVLTSVSVCWTSAETVSHSSGCWGSSVSWCRALPGAGEEESCAGLCVLSPGGRSPGAGARPCGPAAPASPGWTLTVVFSWWRDCPRPPRTGGWERGGWRPERRDLQYCPRVSIWWNNHFYRRNDQTCESQKTFGGEPELSKTFPSWWLCYECVMTWKTFPFIDPSGQKNFSDSWSPEYNAV